MMRRRQFITTSFVTGASAIALGTSLTKPNWFLHEQSGPIRSYDPVVGDGKWIWRDPPAEERGYLEPRSYEVSIGIEMKGTDDVAEAIASTPVPTNHPEQRIEDVSIQAVGCNAEIRDLAPGASQLLMHAPSIQAGQFVKAIATFQITMFKQYHAYERDRFPVLQSVAKDVKSAYLSESPGIQSKAGLVKKLAMEIARGKEHPWDKAQAYVEWIRKSIRPQFGPYTSVLTAIEKRVGDCEEMSALFVAFCRASGIPARLVWVPNHNWTEFALTDHDGELHWIPVHPACYHWFGWTGVHELVLQKGDRVTVPEQGRPSRLIMDCLRSTGRPQTNYVAEMTPLPPTSGGDAGPGTRTKDRFGEWKITGTHPLDRYARR